VWQNSLTLLKHLPHDLLDTWRAKVRDPQCLCWVQMRPTGHQRQMVIFPLSLSPSVTAGPTGSSVRQQRLMIPWGWRREKGCFYPGLAIWRCSAPQAHRARALQPPSAPVTGAECSAGVAQRPPSTFHAGVVTCSRVRLQVKPLCSLEYQDGP
jgi:hypothetical protein